jgi:hypothetical protein
VKAEVSLHNGAEGAYFITADVDSKMHKPRKYVRYADIATEATDASVQKPVELLEFIIQDIMGLELDDKKRIWRMGYYAKEICRAKNIGTENNSLHHTCHYDRLLNGGGSGWETVRLTVEEKLSIGETTGLHLLMDKNELEAVLLRQTPPMEIPILCMHPDCLHKDHKPDRLMIWDSIVARKHTKKSTVEASSKSHGIDEHLSANDHDEFTFADLTT